MQGEATGAGTPIMTQTFFFQTSNGTAYGTGTVTISSNGSVIQYATGYTQCTMGMGTGTYQLDAAVTRLQWESFDNSEDQMRNRKVRASLSTVVSAIVSAVLIAAPTILAAQTTRAVHNFQTNGTDGFRPYAGLILDAAGNLYGTTKYGGVHTSSCGGSGCGTVFRLSLNAKGNWVKTLLRSFGTGGAANFLWRA
jgi:uncharacterized repeat protein (TIGR03803 family)